MRKSGMLGLTVVLAFGLMAAILATSATATVLCTEPLTSGCAAAGKDEPIGTVVHVTSSGSEIAETTGGTTLVTCTSSTKKGKTTSTGGSTQTVTGSHEVVTYSGCTNTVAVIGLGKLEVHYISGTDNGTLTFKLFEVTVNGIFGESCVYGSGEARDIGTIVGGDPASLELNTLFSRISGGGLCPAETRWTGKWIVTSPKPLYIAAS